MDGSLKTRKAAPHDAASKGAQQRMSFLELARELGDLVEAYRQRGTDRTSFREWNRGFHCKTAAG